MGTRNRQGLTISQAAGSPSHIGYSKISWFLIIFPCSKWLFDGIPGRHTQMSFCSRSPLLFLFFRPSCDGNPVSSHYLPNISWLIKLNYPSFSWLTSTQPLQKKRTRPPKNLNDQGADDPETGTAIQRSQVFHHEHDIFEKRMK